jgi:hydrogenase nickel incorporation protein HypB
MCVTCGCSDDAHVTVTHLDHESHTHTLPDGTVIHHSHHHHDHANTDQIHADIHHTTLTLEHNILAKNNLIAAQN